MPPCFGSCVTIAFGLERVGQMIQQSTDSIQIDSIQIQIQIQIFELLLGKATLNSSKKLFFLAMPEIPLYLFFSCDKGQLTFDKL
jgi:hypothetical protein